MGYQGAGAVDGQGWSSRDGCHRVSALDVLQNRMLVLSPLPSCRAQRPCFALLPAAEDFLGIIASREQSRALAFIPLSQCTPAAVGLRLGAQPPVSL